MITFIQSVHNRQLLFSSVTQSCRTLCDPMNCSTLGLLVHHQLLESTQPCPLCQWCHPTISSSVIRFSSCPQSFPASESFQMSQLFASGSQSFGVSASTSVLPMNTQNYSPLGWTGWISLSPRDSQESSQTPQFKSINSFMLSFLYSPTLTSIHNYWKNHSLDSTDLCWQSNVSAFFNKLSRLVITFLPRSKLLISWLQSPSAVILEPPK